VPTPFIQPWRAARRLCRGALVVFAAALLAQGHSAGGPVPPALNPDPAPLTDNLYGTSFVDARTGWAVGAFGTIAHTTDAGASWRRQPSGTLEHLYAVHFVDARTGWAVGRAGTVLHTTDGGVAWTRQAAGTPQHLFDVRALDGQRAWAVGDWGAVVHTTDGGTTWQDRSLPRDVILNAQAWPDPTHGWIVGEAGTIVHTADGGATWQDQTSPAAKTLFGVFFRDAQTGWAVGLDGLILRTRDGGTSWEVQRGDPTVGALEQVGFREALDNPSLYDVSVQEPYGYAVGDTGAVFRSADSGASWQRATVPSTVSLRWIRALALVPGTHGVCVGANGLTLRLANDEVLFTENPPDAAAPLD